MLDVHSAFGAMAEFVEPERMPKMWNLLVRQLDVGHFVSSCQGFTVKDMRC